MQHMLLQEMVPGQTRSLSSATHVCAFDPAGVIYRNKILMGKPHFQSTHGKVRDYQPRYTMPSRRFMP